MKIAVDGPDEKPLNVRTRADLEKIWPALVKRFRPDSGTLAAGTADPVDETDPCITPPAAGFRGPENQLYRVEIVKRGPPGDATFVWSRENGSVLSGWDQQGNRLTLADPGRDRKLGFEPGHWVELTDDVHELTGEPGAFARVTRVEAGVLTVDADTATGPLDPAAFPSNPKLRRWDSNGPQAVEVPTVGDGWIPLEDGLRVRFSTGAMYRTGDYWLIPARVLGGVEWPVVGGVPVQRQPHGVAHHFAPLALFVGGGGAGAAAGLTLVECRYQFPAAAKPV